MAVHDDNDADGEIDSGELLAIYEYDGLHRRIVKLLPDGEDYNRTDYTGIVLAAPPPPWSLHMNSLDALGNWWAYAEVASGVGTISQYRTHNAANEITDLSENIGSPWIDPTYDAAGDASTAATDVRTQYVWDVRYIDAPVLRWHDLDDDQDFDDDWSTDAFLRARG